MVSSSCLSFRVWASSRAASSGSGSQLLTNWSKYGFFCSFPMVKTWVSG